MSSLIKNLPGICEIFLEIQYISKKKKENNNRNNNNNNINKKTLHLKMDIKYTAIANIAQSYLVSFPFDR